MMPAPELGTRDIAVRALAAIEQHMDDCVQYREAMDRRRQEDNVRSARMHSENQEQLDELYKAVTAERAGAGWAVSKILIAALGTVLVALGTAVWWIVTRGGP